MWPEYDCDENGGEGWTAKVITVKGKWSRCKFLYDTDAKGNKFYSEWIETSRLTPVGDGDKGEPMPPTTPIPTITEPPPPTLPPTTDATPPILPPGLSRGAPRNAPSAEVQEAGDQWLVPDANTLPHTPGADPLKEPTRPRREHQ